MAEEPLVVAGLRVLATTFQELDPAVAIELAVEDGQWIEGGTRLGTARGSAAGLLAGERVALNFLQRLSGIATATRRIAERDAKRCHGRHAISLPAAVVRSS